MRLSLAVSRAAAAFALAAVLAACNSSSSTSSSSSSGATGGTVKIGVDLPVSGADASIGIPTQNGVVLAVEEANKNGFAGGKFKLEASLLDDAVQGQARPERGRAERQDVHRGRRGARDGGPLQLQRREGGDPAVQRRRARADLAVEYQRRADDRRRREEAAHGAPGHQRVLPRVHARRQARSNARAGRRAAVQSWKKAFIIDDNETYGKGLADVFDAQYRQLGGTVLGHEHITANQVDFKALLTKIKSQNPDVVFFGGNTSTGGGLIRRQMADVGMAKTPYLGGDGISDPEFEKQAGDMANGAYMTFAAPDAKTFPPAKAFTAAYTARFKGDPGPYSANAYTAAKIEIAAIEKAIADNARQDADARGRAQERRGDRELRLPDRQDRVRRERRHDVPDAVAAEGAGRESRDDRRDHGEVLS